jgi:integrase
MSRHPSLIYQTLERLDSLRAFGVSRHDLKAEQRSALRARGLPTAWSHSTGRIHSFGTAETYKHQVLAYCEWARAEAGVCRLEELDGRASALVRTWLERQLASGKSPYTVQMSRSALRLFHQDRTLGAEVKVPRRRRETIRRSRLPVPSDRRVSSTRHGTLLAFLHATGLRRREVTALRVGDVELSDLGPCVHVRNGKGGQARLVPALSSAEELFPPLLAGRAPEERLFPRIPNALDVHACRRAYAQALYRVLSGRELPNPHGRLKPGSYDPESVDHVSWALGHRRLDVVLRHYLRWGGSARRAKRGT